MKKKRKRVVLKRGADVNAVEEIEFQPGWVAGARALVDRVHSGGTNVDAMIAQTMALRDVASRAFHVLKLGRHLEQIVDTAGNQVFIEEVGAMWTEVNQGEQGHVPDAEMIARRKRMKELLRRPDVREWQRSLQRAIALVENVIVLAVELRRAETPPEVRNQISEQINGAFEKIVARSDHNAIRFDVIEAVRFVAEFHVATLLDRASAAGLIRRDALDRRCPGWRQPTELAQSLIGTTYLDVSWCIDPPSLAMAIRDWGREAVWKHFEAIFKEAKIGTLPAADIKTQYYREASGMKDVARDPARRIEMWRQLACLLDVLGCGHVAPEWFDDEWRRLAHP